MDLQRLQDELLRFGAALPGAWEDHPWGEVVLKVGTKVFVFFGRPGAALCFSVKLPRSGESVLERDWAEPTGYGLGKSGWVTIGLERGDEADAADPSVDRGELPCGRPEDARARAGCRRNARGGAGARSGRPRAAQGLITRRS
jgi:predicted DNA-binding protein (MmcQ/YjbR family)